MTAHPKRLHRGTAGPRSLTAPLQSTPTERLATLWIDRHDPADTTYLARTTSTADRIPGTVPVQAYRDYFDEYRGHPENKSTRPRRQAMPPMDGGAAKPTHRRSRAQAAQDREGEPARGGR